MTTPNILDSITNFGDEMTTTDGVRAAAAWFAMTEPDADYALDDEEAPYKLRAVVGEQIGWDAAQAGLDPEGDIPRYVDYMRLRDAYGHAWPFASMERHLAGSMELDGTSLKPALVVGTWTMAVARYVEARAAHEEQQEEALEVAA